MHDQIPSVRLLSVDTHVLPTRTRFPFRYGIAAMTTAPHLILRARFEINGIPTVGITSEGLPPKWFTKNPDTTFEQDLPDMLEAISHAITAAIDIGKRRSFFRWWRRLIKQQKSWAREAGIPPLLAQLGTALIERAGLDSLCRALNEPLSVAVAEHRLGLRLDRLHKDLDANFLPPPSVDASVHARHTVGLADPLTDADIPNEDRADDGLPQSLEANIDAYGLSYFKIKICGQLDTDLERLTALTDILRRKAPGYRYTLDGNEQYKTLAEFREHWQAFHDHPPLIDFLSSAHLLFVEQPVHRDHALDDRVATELENWPGAPPLIIDESDSDLSSASRALELGYSGTSHKNCKGVIKGMANCALLAERRARNPDQPAILSGEDLANLGPIALQQDLAAMQLLGIRHVERNGHHYFPGLSAWPESIQAATLRDHSDLYRVHTHPDGRTLPTLNVRNGELDLRSVMSAPFGTAFQVDEMEPDWEWKPFAELKVADLIIQE